MFYDILCELCNKSNISLTKLAIDLGISKSNVTNWKRGSIPKSDKINKIAAYFNVSTDYLLGNSDIKKAPSPQLSEDASKKLSKLLNMVDGLSEDEWQKLMDYANLMRSARHNNKDD